MEREIHDEKVKEHRRGTEKKKESRERKERAKEQTNVMYQPGECCMKGIEKVFKGGK